MINNLLSNNGTKLLDRCLRKSWQIADMLAAVITGLTVLGMLVVSLGNLIYSSFLQRIEPFTGLFLLLLFGGIISVIALSIMAFISPAKAWANKRPLVLAGLAIIVTSTGLLYYFYSERSYVIANLVYSALFLLLLLGGIIGVIALSMAALIAPLKIYANKRQKILVLFGLIIGIVSSMGFLWGLISVAVLMTALILLEKSCPNKHFRSLVFVSLIFILACLASYLSGPQFVFSKALTYMDISAVAHIIELLRCDYVPLELGIHAIRD